MIKLISAIIILPFKILWSIGLFVLSLVGKGLTLLFGLLLIILGIIFSITIVGILIGVPIMMLGLSLILSALFK